MEKIIEKIEEYKLVSEVIPGYIFLWLLQYWCEINIAFENVFQEFIVAFVVGIIISRIGSLVLSKALRKFKAYKMADYKDYIKASDKDNKIKVILLNANMYRNLCTSCVLVIIVKIIYLMKLGINVYTWIGMIMISILFLIAFLKEENTITKRVNISKDL